MKNKTEFLTRSQIVEVRRLLSTGLYGIPTIARRTGVSIRDVFRIRRTLLTAALDLILTTQTHEQQ